MSDSGGRHDGGAPAGAPSCSLGAAGLACDLVQRPWEYPGVRAPSAGLLVGERFFPLEVLPGRPTGELRVADVEARWSPAPGAALPLDEALRREGVATTDERTVVVATGSNAAPAGCTASAASVVSAAWSRSCRRRSATWLSGTAPT